MKILTAAEMGVTDGRTAEQFGIPLRDLMERAGEEVALFCARQYPRAHHVTVLCGGGNNGGDGLVAARCLAHAGRSVHVLLTVEEANLRGEAALALERLHADTPHVQVDPLRPDITSELTDDVLMGAELIVDALVGTGFKPPLRSVAVDLRERVRKLTTPVVAVDLAFRVGCRFHGAER